MNGPPTVSTRSQYRPMPTFCCSLQATAQLQQPMHLFWSTTIPRRVAFCSRGSGTSTPGYDELIARPLREALAGHVSSSPSRPFHLHEAVVVGGVGREVGNERLRRIGDLVGQVVGVTLDVLLDGQRVPTALVAVDDPRLDGLRELGVDLHLAAVVEHAHNLALGDAARLGV